MTGLFITNSEFSRVKASIQPKIAESDARDTLLKNRSIRRVSSWANTVEAERLKHQHEKEERIAAEEAHQRQLDIDEANLQLQKRRLAIQRANQLLIAENDRMKTMNSAMMLSDVLGERDNQIRIKEQLEKLEHIRNLKFDELVKHNVSRIQDREDSESKQREEKKRMVAIIQKEQLEEAKQKYLTERAAERRDGELIKHRNEAFLAAEVERKNREREVALHAQKETIRAQTYLNEIKARELERVQKEDVLIQQYAKAKDDMIAKRKARELEIFRQKQLIRQRLIDQQASALQLLTRNEDERIAQQCRDADAEQERLMEERKKKTRQWKLEIDESRRLQIERKQTEEANRVAQERQASQFCRLLFQKLEQDEQAEAAERRDAARRLAHDLQLQTQIREKKAKQEKTAEIEVAQRARRGILADSNEFQSYAESIIREYAESGKDVIPLIHALKNFHKTSNE